MKFGVMVWLVLVLLLRGETWTKADGETFEGEVIRVSGSMVMFETPSGRTLLSLESLSGADQARIREAYGIQEPAPEITTEAPPPADGTDRSLQNRAFARAVVGKPAPKLEIPTQQGVIGLDDFRDRVVLVIFWGEDARENLRIEEPLKKVVGAYQRFNFSYFGLLPDRSPAIYDRWAPRGLPAMAVIGGDGRVVATDNDPFRIELAIREAINQLAADYQSTQAQGGDEPPADAIRGTPDIVGAFAIGEEPSNITAREQGSPETVSLQGLRGYLVLVHFWNYQSERARREAAQLVPVYERLRNRGLRIISVHVGGSQLTLNDVEEELGLRWPAALDGRQFIMKRWDLKTLPVYVLVGQNGRIVSVQATASALEPALRRYLNLEEP